MQDAISVPSPVYSAGRASRRWWRRTLAGLALLTGLAAGQGAQAHALGQSYVFLRLGDEVVSGRFEMTVADANKAIGLDFATDGSVTPEQVTPHAAAVEAYVRRHLRLAPDGQPAEFEVTGHGLFTIRKAQYVQLFFSIDALQRPPETIVVDYSGVFEVDPDHRGLLVVEHNWKTATFDDESNVVLTFSPDAQRLTLDLSESTVWNGFLGMLELGIHHIWVGIDHILFLLALLLPSVMRREGRRWVPVPGFREALIQMVKIVTVFTVAHSITLSLAALEVVSLPSRLVESVIAISIAIAAADIFFPLFRRRIWAVVFVFGLFHGFGFASVLSEMGVPANYLVLSLFGFNVGVEIGQLVIVCIVFPLLFAVRASLLYGRYVLHSGAALMIAVALYWFVERAFEIDLPAGYLVQKLLGVA